MRISFDIDGIFTNYPNCWIRFANEKLGTNYKSKENMKSDLGSKYEEVKSQYRKSKYKANLTPQKQFVRVARSIDEKDNEIVIATSRPMNSEEFPNLRKLTKDWLVKNNIPHEILVKKENVVDMDIKYHIDDEVGDAKQIAKSGVTVYIYGEQTIDHEYIEFFDNPEDVLSKVT